ncbi:MAG: hypothetical protein ACMUIP_10615 [bacterium]
MLKKRIMVIIMGSLLFIMACGQTAKRIEIRQRFKRGKIDNLTEEELMLEKNLKEAAQLKAAIDYAKEIFKVAYIIAEEHPNLGFTIYFQGSSLIVERGLDVAKEPDLVIPLSDEGINNAKRFFEDGIVDENEEFLIVNALFKPAWEASYRIPDIQSAWIKKYMNLDILLHVRLKNDNKITFKEKIINNELTVVSAREQWLVFSGLEGNPDQVLEITPKDAIAMYKLIIWDLKKATTLQKKYEIMQNFMDIRNRCRVKG